MFNEEARVERAVRNFLTYGRVLIVDNYSTDRTVEIAKSLGADVLLYKNQGWVEDEHTTRVVKNAVQTPWIYWGFADEIVDCSTMDRMLAAIENGQFSIINIARKNYYYGKFLYDAYYNVQNRVFKKDSIDFRGNTIHKFGKPTVPESEIHYLDPQKFYIHHFISNTTKANLDSLNRYTDIEADHVSSASPIKMIYRFVKSFLGHFFLNGGYKAGRVGFLYIVQMSFYNMALSIKSFEREHQLTTSSVEERNNIVRDRLLHDIIKNRSRSDCFRSD
jgi:glycosyltransferase involved in cell wall biosynthesis